MAARGGSKQEGVSLARLAGMGTEFLSAILGGLLIGWLIDKWLQSYPTATVIGVVAGILVGGVSFFRTAMAANRKAMESYRREHPGSKNPDDNGK